MFLLLLFCFGGVYLQQNTYKKAVFQSNSSLCFIFGAFLLTETMEFITNYITQLDICL